MAISSGIDTVEIFNYARSQRVGCEIFGAVKSASSSRLSLRGAMLRANN